MIRWTLVVMAVLVSGCGRQVSIVDPNDGSSVASVPETPVSVTNVPSTPTPVQNPEPAPAPTPAPEPVVETPAPTPGPAQPAEAQVRLSVPDALLVTSDLGDIIPVLQESDGRLIRMDCCDDANGWTAAVALNQQSEWVGKVLWRATDGIEAVVVLESDIRVVGGSSVQDITPSDYERGVDSDGDGVDNLTELLLGTNPNDITDADPNFLSASVRIPRISANQRPIIDGVVGEYEPGTLQLMGEWASAVSQDVNGNLLTVGNRMFTSPGFLTGIENHHWAAMHDGTFLYLLVIIDDAGLHQFDTREFAKPWRDDSIEVFFDGNNSQAPNYDGIDDTNIHFMLLDSIAGGVNSSSNPFPKVFQAVNSVPLPPSLVFTTGPLSGPAAPEGFTSDGVSQDVYEISVRISDLNIELGRTFGFEVQFDDDDDGLDRDAKWGWHHPAGISPDNDFTWRDPRYMGRVVLLP